MIRKENIPTYQVDRWIYESSGAPTRRHPTWATVGAMGIYSWSLPLVIAGSLLSTLGIMMADPQ